MKYCECTKEHLNTLRGFSIVKPLSFQPVQLKIQKTYLCLAARTLLLHISLTPKAEQRWTWGAQQDPPQHTVL